MKQLSNRLSPRGFSLVEVMIAVSLMGVGGYFLAAMLRTGVVGQKTIQAQDDARGLVVNMESLLLNAAACKNTFLGLDPVAGAPVEFIKDGSSSPVTQFTAKLPPYAPPYEKYGNRGVQLYSITIGGPGKDPRTQIQKWTPDPSFPGRGTAFVEVDWLQTGGPGERAGPQHLLRYFMVYVTNIDATNKIVDCTAMSGGGGGSLIWRRNTTDSTKIYYDEGNVGIGTLSPVEKFQVEGGGVLVNNDAQFSFVNIKGNGGAGPFHAGVNLSGPLAADTWGMQYRQDTGNLTFGYFPSGFNTLEITKTGNVGIGTTTPQTKMDVAGGVKIGNEATCNAAHAGTIRWTGAVFEGCDGTAWAPFGGSGSCPTGMVSAGSYCIDMNERAPLSWWNAATACRTAGFQLCTTAQWHPACVAGLALNMTDNLEWAGDMAYHVSQYHAVVIGIGSCTSGTVVPPAAAAYGFRCCKHK